MSARPDPIAVVSMAGVFPGAPDLDGFWNNIAARRDAVRDVPPGRWIIDPARAVSTTDQPDRVPHARGCYLDDFELDAAGLNLDPRLLDRLDELDPVYRLVLKVGRDAWRGGRNDTVDRARVGIALAAIALPTEGSSALTRAIFGPAFDSALGPMCQADDGAWHADGFASPDPGATGGLSALHGATGGLPASADCEPGATGRSSARAASNPLDRYARSPLNSRATGMPAGMLASALGLGGGAFTLDAACASSLYAVKLACDDLRAGRVDAMLAGGVSRPECLYTQMGFSRLQALSRRGQCRPFDAQGDGLIVGEGAGMVLLKRLDDAQRDGDAIHAVIHAVGLSNDIGGSLLAPDSEGQLRAMRDAYAAAGWTPTDVDLIECHGTGTPLGDAIEVQSLRAMWEGRAWRPGQCPIGSVKSNVGHLLTAAGAAGLIKTILAMRAETLPPSANFERAAPAMPLDDGPFRVQTAAQPWPRRDECTPRRAAVSAFGFGGINAHLLISEYMPCVTATADDAIRVFPVASSLRPDDSDIDAAEFSADTVDVTDAACSAEPVATGVESDEPIAIVGMAARFGEVSSLREFQERMLRGDTAITARPADRWRGGKPRVRDAIARDDLPGAYVSSIEVEIGRFRLPPSEIPEILPQQLLMLIVAAAAMEDAGLSLRDRRPRMGTTIGIGLDLATSNFHLRWWLEQRAADHVTATGMDPSAPTVGEWTRSIVNAAGPALSAPATVGALGGIVASRVARELQLGGPSFAVSAEECSGPAGLDIAMRALRRGEVDVMLVGAVDLAGDARLVAANASLRAFSRSGAVRPHDAAADGTLPGEGATAIVVKRLSDAVRDGDRIYAVIRGVGRASGVRDNDELSRTCETAIRRACADADVSPADLTLIETHAGGDPREDAAERDALVRVFAAADGARAMSPAGRRGSPVALGAATPTIGLCGAAAGLASIVRAAIQLYQQIIAPIPGFGRPFGGVDSWAGDAFHVAREPQFWMRDRIDGPRRAGATSIGLDGGCTHVILEEYAPRAAANTIDRRHPLGARDEALFVVSADETGALARQLDQLARFVEERSATASIESLARAWFDAGHDARRGTRAVALLATDARQLARRIHDTTRAIQAAPSRRLSGHGGAWYSPEPLADDAMLALVYPGSGSHQIGMGRDLALAFPQVARDLDADTPRLASHLSANEFTPRRLDWSANWQRDAAAAINADPLTTIYGQVSYGVLATDVLRHFGVNPHAVIGYSLGESASLFAMRAWTARDEMYKRLHASPLFRTDLAGEFNAARKAWNLGPDDPVDWFAALIARPAADVKAALQGVEQAALLIVNTPNECVVGGRRPSVLAVAKSLRCRPVALESVPAVHGDMARGVEAAYLALHDLHTTPPPGARFYSCAWARAYDVNRARAAASITEQALRGFDFPKLIKQAYRDGVRIFVETGPQGSCTRMIDRILDDKPHVAVSIGARGRGESAAVLRVLATLAAERVPINLTALYGAESCAVAHQPTVAEKPRTIRVATGGKPFAAPASPFANSLEFPRQQSDAIGGSPVPGATGGLSAPAFGATGGSPASADREPWSAHARTPVAMPSFHPPTEHAVIISNSIESDLAQTIAASNAAHEAFIRFSSSATGQFGRALDIRNQLIDAVMTRDGIPAIANLALPPLDGLHAESAGGHAGRANHSDSPECHADSRTTVGSPARILGATGGLSASASGTTVGSPARILGATGGLSASDDREFARHTSTTVESPVALTREQCMEFAVGSVAAVFGPDFADADTFPTRVRLPDEPLMLVDRILSIEGQPRSMTGGRVVTAHDVHPGAWYLDGDRAPVCITVEAGQADLFLSGYLGIDLQTRGLRMYRLLDATVTFHRGLPRPGETIIYDIRIDRFVRQGDTWLFFFQFDGTINGQPVLTMRDGCAGFFTYAEIEASGGIILTEAYKKDAARKRPTDWRELVPLGGPESYDDARIAALRAGDLAGCFGPHFANLTLADPLRIPGGRMKLLDRVPYLDPTGGRFGLGIVRAEADVHPDDWYLTCHFVDDMVMPGTLMYECCAHTLRVLLLRLGWVGESTRVAYEPMIGAPARLRCRGPVTASTKKVVYEVEIREIGYRPEPYVIADALMYADGRRIVRFEGMSIRMTGATRDEIEAIWALALPFATGAVPDNAAGATGGLSASAAGAHGPDSRAIAAIGDIRLPGASEAVKPAIFNTDRIRAFAIGKPSDAFGEPYRVFDEDRRIARLPGPPYQFLDRVTEIHDCRPFELRPGGWIECQYDVPPDAWYFAANRQASMPFSVLLEIALQPCGWLAAYLGSALRGRNDLSFRNLSGTATQTEDLFADAGTLTTRTRITGVSEAGGMILQNFDFQVWRMGRCIYNGVTSFGFFSKAALANQVGIRDAGDRIYLPTAEENARARTIELEDHPPHTPDETGATGDSETGVTGDSESGVTGDSESGATGGSPASAERGHAPNRVEPLAMPARAYRMIDAVDLYIPDGGPHGLGFALAHADVDPDAWFFKAHFFQDPVWPGSLGLESFIQVLKAIARDRWPHCIDTHRFEAIALNREHTWLYRGQIIPANRRVEVEVVVTHIVEEPTPTLTASGFLKVDGKYIYEMIDFAIRLIDRNELHAGP